jgi:Methylamine utilisation protein MauE
VGALALAARVVLAVALVVAAGAKFADRTHVVAQMGDLVGARAAPVASVVVPAAETVIGVALVALPHRSLPAWCAIALLVAFTVVLVQAQARHVPCPCFGGGTSARAVGPAAIVRNGVLLALAVLATGSIDGAHAGATLAWILGLGVVTGIAVRAAR